jgi:hypothetical protein
MAPAVTHTRKDSTVAARKTPEVRDASRLDSTPGSYQEPRRGRGARTVFVPVLVFAAWLLALIGLTVATANPITLNRQQILDADLVIEASITNAATGECSIKKSWPERIVDTTMTLPELRSMSLNEGQSYLLPLTVSDDGGYRLARTPPPLSRPLIYAATADSRAQLAAILGP